MNNTAPDKKRPRGFYILPNLFTTASLFTGFYAIVQSMNGNFYHAATAIFVSMVLDGMDGRVARLTNTQSAFGAEYDSLSDMVAFGVAPALIMYEWALKDLGKLGWIAAFIYCSGGALRLARFNTNINVIDKRYFQGLPIPSAAALIAGMVWVCNDNAINPSEVSILAAILTIFAGITMVTNILFWSGKSLSLQKRVPFIVGALLILIFALVSTDPPVILFALFLIYSLSGYVTQIYRMIQRRRRKYKINQIHPQEPTDSHDQKDE